MSSLVYHVINPTPPQRARNKMNNPIHKRRNPLQYEVSSVCTYIVPQHGSRLIEASSILQTAINEAIALEPLLPGAKIAPPLPQSTRARNNPIAEWILRHPPPPLPPPRVQVQAQSQTWLQFPSRIRLRIGPLHSSHNSLRKSALRYGS